MIPDAAREWLDALDFDGEFGEEGPQALAARVAELEAAGRSGEAHRWLSIGDKLAQLCRLRATPPH